MSTINTIVVNPLLLCVNSLRNCPRKLLLTVYRPAYPKMLLSVLPTAYVRSFTFLTFFFFFFLADVPPISQNKTVSQVNFSITHLVRTVCELTSSIIQTHYTQTTLFCLYLRKLFLIEDCKTFSPKTMHHVCCFR